MKPSKHPLIHIAFSLLAAAFTLAPLGAQAEPSKPNIILVMPDDPGYGNYRCLGNERRLAVHRPGRDESAAAILPRGDALNL